MRLADNFKTLVSTDDIKKYKGTVIQLLTNCLKKSNESSLRILISRTQLNSQLSRIEEDPSEHISENEISKWKVDQQHE